MSKRSKRSKKNSQADKDSNALTRGNDNAASEESTVVKSLKYLLERQEKLLDHQVGLTESAEKLRAQMEYQKPPIVNIREFDMKEFTLIASFPYEEVVIQGKPLMCCTTLDCGITWGLNIEQRDGVYYAAIVVIPDYKCSLNFSAKVTFAATSDTEAFGKLERPSEFNNNVHIILFDTAMDTESIVKAQSEQTEKILFEVTIKIEELLVDKRQDRQDFDNTDGSCDAVLNVEDWRYNVRKEVLASQSTYFASLFFGGIPFSENGEHVVQKFDHLSYGAFLAILHNKYALTADTVEKVLQIAEYHTADNVLAKCGNYLIYQAKMPWSEILALLVDYRLEKHVERFLSKISDIDFIENALEEHEKQWVQDLLKKRLQELRPRENEETD